MTIDLSTTYLGLKLATPLVAGPGPITDRRECWAMLEEAGAGAIVLPSLWEEQIEHYDQQALRLSEYGADSFGEALSYFPDMDDQRGSPDVYLRKVEDAKRSVAIPVIGSLNGVTRGGWVRYAKSIEQAGADALELNIYFLATDPALSAADIERQYLDLIAAVRAEVRIPVAVKIGPYFSALAHFAARVAALGVNGLVLFNRFLQPDIHLDTLEVAPNLVLSQPWELRLPLRWIAILRPNLSISLAGNSGVHSSDDVVKLLLAGADVVVVVSSLLQRGAKHIQSLVAGLRDWLADNEYESVKQMKGSLSHANCPDPAAFERANYMQALRTYSSTFNMESP